MQERHKNRYLYFKELSVTSKKYFIPYLQRWHTIKPGMNVLEIGCGDGGNLLPFSEMGCNVTGVDMAGSRIKDAILFFERSRAKSTFIASDIFELEELQYSFDIILCHDVLEHIAEKSLFLSKLKKYLKPQGVVFMSFPAWQMPFGGHQQICRSNILSHFPFIHLFPNGVYTSLLKSFGEEESCIKELLSIKGTKTSIELFEHLIFQTDLEIVNRQLYFINPHYEIKFGLKPRKLSPFISSISYVRNFFTSSCFYLLKG